MRAAWVSLLVGCNQVYGLDGTTIAPSEAGITVPPDLDRDGVTDAEDLCPGVPDPMQKDGDGDGFGDLCDGCPTIKTAVNHDEDGDSYGDACDICPADPDFQIDTDMDGVGDFCDDDFASQNTLVLFDPFLDIGAQWEQKGTWSQNGDTVSGPTEATLTSTTALLDGSKPFAIALGTSIAQPLAFGSPGFRLELVDASGVPLGCEVRCATPSCSIQQQPFAIAEPVGQLPPLSVLYLRRTITLDACVFGGVAATPNGADPPVFGPVRIRITGSPAVRFRFLAVRQ